MDGPGGRTSSFYLKPWPVCIFKDFPFSLYIVAASESDEGLVFVKEKKMNKNAYAEELKTIWKAMGEVKKYCKYCQAQFQ